MKVIQSVLLFLIFISCKHEEYRNDKNATFQNLELKAYPYNELVNDFDLLVNSLKEAHTGLYWYSKEEQFDSLVAVQRLLLKDSLNGLQFYNIVSPIVAFSKEDHCDIYLSEEIAQALAEKGLFIPLLIINIEQKPIALNQPYKGFELVSVNEVEIKDIYQRVFNTFASDGFILSSKYRYLDFRGFSKEYAKVIDQKEENTIRIRNPRTGKIETHNIISVSAKELIELQVSVSGENTFREEIQKPAGLKFLDEKTALLTFRTFSNSNFKKHQMNFKKFVDSSFVKIHENKSNHLIIDMRDNGGGSEGNEDYLFSYLTNTPYNKYKYVELSRFNFSFLNNTDYSSLEDSIELVNELRSENEELKNGKIYRRSGIYVPERIKDKPFAGNVYVLTSGWTYSGGAEFSALMKEHTHATFIGEETGGGYFGNTSGTSLELTLPNTKLVMDIPILKFVLDVKKGSFGRGTIPDFEVQPTFEQFINGEDAELDYTKKLIDK